MKFREYIESREVLLSEFIDGIGVVGDKKFIEKTKSALILLRGSKSFREIKGSIGIIEQSNRSGMIYWHEPPKYKVGKSTYDSDLKWYASTIAHDTYHSELYRRGENPNGKNAEVECLKLQRQVLLEIGGSSYFIRYIDDHMLNPTYQDIDYEKRNW